MLILTTELEEDQGCVASTVRSVTDRRLAMALFDTLRRSTGAPPRSRCVSASSGFASRLRPTRRETIIGSITVSASSIRRTQDQSRATDRGRPNRAITPLSNAVIALTRSPTKVTTIRPNACATRLMGLKR